MGSVAAWEAISDMYTEYFSAGDSRVTSWFLMESPAPTFAIVGIYLIFVKIVGPAWMKDREPFELRRAMVFYNFGVVASYVYFIHEALKCLVKEGKDLTCRSREMNDPTELRLAELGWWFYFFKLVELIDTVFFVLRKKFQQISTLHVIHHSIVPVAVWFGYRVEPASYNYFFPLINTVVHIVMYTYYGLAALGPGVQKYLWWKKHLTALQMAQFIVVFIYLLVLIAANCRVSKFILYLNAFLAGLFLLLFLNFFYNSYVKAKTSGGNNNKAKTFEGNNNKAKTFEENYNRYNVSEGNNSRMHRHPRIENGPFSPEKVSTIFCVSDDLISCKNRSIYDKKSA